MSKHLASWVNCWPVWSVTASEPLETFTLTTSDLRSVIFGDNSRSSTRPSFQILVILLAVHMAISVYAFGLLEALPAPSTAENSQALTFPEQAIRCAEALLRILRSATNYTEQISRC